jgi:MFS transporter, DHA1 family, tetracycline resistance protein
VGPAVRHLGERRAVLIGLLAGVSALALYGLAPTGGWFLVAVPLDALTGFYLAAAQALATKQVPAGEQGQLQGVRSSLAGLTGLIGPLIFGMTFRWGIAPAAAGGLGLPGAPFLLASLCTAAAFLIALKVTRQGVAGVLTQPTEAPLA